MSGNGKKKVDWQPFKMYEADDLVVKVNTLPLDKPRYSVAIGRKHSEDAERIVLFWPIEKIPEMITLMESAYSEHLQSEAESDIAAMERLQAKEEKRKNYLANVERRKQENRDRAHGGKKQK